MASLRTLHTIHDKLCGDNRFSYFFFAGSSKKNAIFGAITSFHASSRHARRGEKQTINRTNVVFLCSLFPSSLCPRSLCRNQIENRDRRGRAEFQIHSPTSIVIHWNSNYHQDLLRSITISIMVLIDHFSPLNLSVGLEVELDSWSQQSNRNSPITFHRKETNLGSSRDRRIFSPSFLSPFQIRIAFFSLCTWPQVIRDSGMLGDIQSYIRIIISLIGFIPPVVYLE